MRYYGYKFELNGIIREKTKNPEDLKEITFEKIE